MKLLPRIFIVVLTAAFASSCSSLLKRDINTSELSKVKTTAVILYTVPDNIERRDNPRQKNKDGLFGALMKMAAKASSKEAATLAHKTFSETLQKHNLSFSVMSRQELLSNKAFTSLRSTVKAKTKADSGMLGTALSFLGGSSASKLHGVGPQQMVAFGLSPWGNGGSALDGTSEEKQYIMAAIQALNVDAAIIVADSGFSFSCEVCIGGSGAASTGSAFFVSMVNKDGKTIMNLQEWFATTDAQAAMITGAVNPGQHASLFEEHGRKMANVFAASLNEGLKKK